jgi:glycosyltransferase involved in cell wall biosynthesis
MVTLANAFAIRGYDVDLVLAVAQGPYLKDVAEAVRVVDLKAGRIIRCLFPLTRYLRQERPVAMLSAMTHANVVALLARTLVRTPTRLVVSERTTISMEVNRVRDLVARINFILASALYVRADGVVAVSKAGGEDLARFAHLPASVIKVIYNPFELERIQARAAEAVTHPWFEAGQPPVVLAIGRLNQAKDYPTLIRAFARLRTEGCSLRLLILGEGELKGMLEALVSECGLTTGEVQMPGFVPNPFSYLARSGVFVLSSRYEGLPGALIEAMACGVPVVSTDCPSGPREILEDGRWGALVPVGDENALAKAINTVLSTPRAQLPDVRFRARDFDHVPAVDAYLRVLGLPQQRISCAACDQSDNETS